MSPSSARKLDQFYTSSSLALALVAQLRAHLGDDAAGARWLEPSAGGGAFLDALPLGAIGLDIAPTHARVQEANFLHYVAQPHANWIVVGNPPFGKNASLAIQFFNRAAAFAQVIAFIVPKTFQKESAQRRLSAHFHLELQLAVPHNSFIFEGQTVDVPCVFQVWRRQEPPRVINRLPISHPDFTYTSRDLADFAFQRVGARAGAIKDIGPDGRGLSGPSHHFIRVVDRLRVQQVRSRFNALDWTDIKNRTAGNPSIAKTEIVSHYTNLTH